MIKSLSKKSNSTLSAQFFRYSVVGGIAFVVDFAVLVVLTEFAGLHYLISAPIGFICGLIFNYTLCVKWVFHFRGVADKRAEFIVFALVGLIGLGINEIVMAVLTEYLGVHYALSKIAATASVFLLNFSFRRYLLFREKPSRSWVT